MENILTKIFACTKKVTFYLEKSLLWIYLFEMIQTLFYLILSYNFHDKKDYTFSARQFSFEGYDLKTDSLKIVISYYTYYEFFSESVINMLKMLNSKVVSPKYSWNSLNSRNLLKNWPASSSR